MSMIAANPHSAPIAATQTSAVVTSKRDPRLDFYRGMAMFIILFAHTPGNFFTSWIPARWGFSDATEMFVFCSGMASAIAFGRTFDRAGWALGTARGWLSGLAGLLGTYRNVFYNCNDDGILG